MMDHNNRLTRYTRPELPAVYSPVSVQRGVTPQHQLSLGDVLRTIARRWLVILVFTSIAFCAAAAYAYLKTPVYESVVRLQIDPSRSSNLGLDAGDKSTSGSPDADTLVATEVAIVRSNTVAKQVMDSQKLYANPQFAGADVAGPDVKDFSQLAPAQQQRLFDRFDADLTVRVVPNTQVIEVRFRSPDPALATSTANSVIDEYMHRNFHARVDGTAQISQWLSTQMEDIKTSTALSQQKLADFQKTNNFIGADESDNIVTDRLKQLNEELTQAEADRIIKEGRYRLARTSNPELIATVVPNSTLQVLRTQQAELQSQYAQLNSKFGTGYPKLRELQAQLDQLDAAIKAEGGNVETRLANEYGAAAKTEAMIRGNFEKQKASAYKLNEHAAQYASLKHDVESGQQLYDTLQLKLKEAGIASGLNTSYVSIIDDAQLPIRPVEPRKKLDLTVGLGAGLFGGLLLAFVLDSFDDKVGTSHDLETLVAMPELVSVPFLAALSNKKLSRSKSMNSRFPLPTGFNPIALREPDSPAVESYRALCNIILLSAAQNSMKMLIVTSATPGEGKSTVSCNLATALAQRGRKVLMVDADLRSCSSNSQTGTSTQSLTTLCQTGNLDHPQYRPIPILPTLHVLPAGIRSANPTGVLDSVRMQELMAAWRAEYDHIIIDTPPVLLFADALVLAARADAIVMVTRADVSRRPEVLRARDLLERAGGNILGFVLNAVRSPQYYYGYPSSYGPQYAPVKTDPEKTKTVLGGS